MFQLNGQENDLGDITLLILQQMMIEKQKQFLKIYLKQIEMGIKLNELCILCKQKPREYVN